jgi:hypothetical protein
MAVFVKMIIRISRPDREEVTGGHFFTLLLHLLNNEVLHNLYSSPNVFGVIKCRRVRQGGLEVCIVEI